MASISPASASDFTARLSAMEANVAPFAQAQADIVALQATVPAPATSAPPGVAATSDKGTSTRYALENHTHKSSVQAARIPVAGGAGQFTWTFASAFSAGQIPVCTATVENAVGAAQPFVVNLVGQPTNTAATFMVFKAATQTLPGIATSLLNLVINIFSSAPNGIYVNVQARLPTQ